MMTGQASALRVPWFGTEPFQTGAQASEIRLHLRRIVDSAEFCRSLRLSRFLTFIVEAAIAEKSVCIKSYTIGVEALGRAPDFDPQSDPIVRVQAVRLRHALARYYANSGREDTLIIDVPRGSYVPIFRLRESEVQKPKGSLTLESEFDDGIAEC